MITNKIKIGGTIYVSNNLELLLKDTKDFPIMIKPELMNQRTTYQALIEWIFQPETIMFNSNQLGYRESIEWLEFWYNTLIPELCECPIKGCIKDGTECIGCKDIVWNEFVLEAFVGMLLNWFEKNELFLESTRTTINKVWYNCIWDNKNCLLNDLIAYNNKQQARHKGILKYFELIKNEKTSFVTIVNYKFKESNYYYYYKNNGAIYGYHKFRKTNNAYSENEFTKEQAIEAERSNTNCSNCLDCFNCINCNSCEICNNCENCIGCITCSYSKECEKSRFCYKSSNCINCANCLDCYKCVNCFMCYNCISCKYCDYCNNFKGGDYKTHQVVYAKNISIVEENLTIIKENTKKLLIQENKC